MKTDIKCPICSGEVGLFSGGEIEQVSRGLVCEKKYRLICNDCGLNSKYLSVYVRFGYDGNVEVNNREIENEINNWRKASEK